MVMRKAVFFFLYLVHPIALQAKDMGNNGVVYPIDEQDPIILIQSKLKRMEESGELARHRLEIQKKTKTAIERPKSVEGITMASKNRVFYYNPTYVVQEDLKDHQGKIIHSKGTRINPLETVSLSHTLLFFDGDDEQQIAFAKEKFKGKSLKLILTKGAPLALSKELKIPVYFDQSGLLIKKLGIRHVPCVVIQDGLRLRIEEFDLKEKHELPSEIKKEDS